VPIKGLITTSFQEMQAKASNIFVGCVRAQRCRQCWWRRRRRRRLCRINGQRRGIVVSCSSSSTGETSSRQVRAARRPSASLVAVASRRDVRWNDVHAQRRGHANCTGPGLPHHSSSDNSRYLFTRYAQPPVAVELAIVG